MYKIGLAALMLAVTAWAPLPGAGSAVTADRDWEWTGRVDRGDAIEIKGINGDIQAELTSGNEVEVRVRLHGRRDDPDEIEMVVLEHDGGVTICAVYPSEDRHEPNECRRGGHGKMNVKNNDVEVDFTVLVPAGVNFIGRNVNGDVDALGLEGEVKAHTVNGGVDISTTGLAEATSVNGSITVSMDRADWDGTLDFTTVNGSVTLEMPVDLHCDVSISTVNGTISSDYPLTVSGRFSPRHLNATIGDGGRDLVIKTVNGSVQIRRS
jgi:DUF4097 and DUF4098 domain-containing protein YvlB